MNVVILGGNSGIGQELGKRFVADGDRVSSWTRHDPPVPESWDLIVCCIGVLKPIGKFFETDRQEWHENYISNLIVPLELLRVLWPFRKAAAAVCFFSGAGTSNSAKTYSAYATAKIALFKMTELLDDEYADCKFFILGPGMVRTKIQQQTLDAGARADNFARVMKFMNEGDVLHGSGTSHDRIYECLKWCLSLPKEVIGGRNIYVPDEFGPTLEEKLRADPRYYKLRRKE